MSAASVVKDSRWLADRILGPDYELSLALVSARLLRELNRRYRGEDHSPSVLSFPLSSGSGEILLNRQTLGKDRVSLLIHGLLHLKGRRHGSKMEAEEKKFLKISFQHHAPSHRRRPRHRHCRHPVNRL